MSNIFSVQNVAFSYKGGRKEGTHTVFSNLNVTIPEGKVTTLVGANGSGKTTLFNLLTKNLEPDSGTVMLRQGNVAELRRRDLAQLVAIVHQKNTAPADLSVRTLVGYGRTPFHSLSHASETEEDKRIISWAIETTGLTGFEERSVMALSGGQRQRAWIAMALAQGTDVLLLDEPTTYLDVRYQIDTLNLIRRLNRESGITVVMILHDINQSLYYSDEIMALANGEMVAQGAPEEIISPELVRTVYGIDLKITQIEGKPFVLAV